MTPARHAAWNGFKDAALEGGAKLPRRLILERNASGSVAALGEFTPVWTRCLQPTMRMPSASCPAARGGTIANWSRRGATGSPSSASAISKVGRLISPSLSTIRVHGDAIGRTAAKLMLTHSGPRHVDLGLS